MVLLSSVATLFSIIVLSLAMADGQSLKRAGVNGDRTLLVRATIRHEVVRVIQHLLIMFVVMLVISRVENVIQWRNWSLLAFCVLFMLNSAMDLAVRREAMRRFGTRRSD